MEVQNVDTTHINVKVVFYNGKSNIIFSNKNYRLEPEEFENAYNHLQKWCYTFLCNGWNIYLNECSELNLAKMMIEMRGGMNIIMKGDKRNILDNKACYLSMWITDNYN
jgi:hypothetical protein